MNVVAQSPLVDRFLATCVAQSCLTLTVKVILL